MVECNFYFSRTPCTLVAWEGPVGRAALYSVVAVVGRGAAGAGGLSGRRAQLAASGPGRADDQRGDNLNFCWYPYLVGLA
jgi:hypothetical protein